MRRIIISIIFLLPGIFAAVLWRISLSKMPIETPVSISKNVEAFTRKKQIVTVKLDSLLTLAPSETIATIDRRSSLVSFRCGNNRQKQSDDYFFQGNRDLLLRHFDLGMTVMNEPFRVEDKVQKLNGSDCVTIPAGVVQSLLLNAGL